MSITINHRTKKTPADEGRALSVREFAARFGVGLHLVLTLIDAGELAAVDLRLPGASRPRWKIEAEAVAAFLAARSSRPSPKPARRKRVSESYTKWI